MNQILNLFISPARLSNKNDEINSNLYDYKKISEEQNVSNQINEMYENKEVGENQNDSKTKK